MRDGSRYLQFTSIGEIAANIEARMTEERARDKEATLDRFREGKSTRAEATETIRKNDLRSA